MLKVRGMALLEYLICRGPRVFLVNTAHEAGLPLARTGMKSQFASGCGNVRGTYLHGECPTLNRTLSIYSRISLTIRHANQTKKEAET